MATKTAEIMSAKDSGKTFGEGKKIYVVEADGKTYTAFTDKVLALVGQKVEYEEIEKEWPAGSGNMQYQMKLTSANKPAFQGKGGFQKQTHDPATMVLAYAKDIVVAMINSGEIKGITVAEKNLSELYTFMSELLPKEK